VRLFTQPGPIATDVNTLTLRPLSGIPDPDQWAAFTDSAAFDPDRLSSANSCCVARCFLFYRLVGAAKQRKGEGEAQRLGCDHIDDQFDLGDLLHGDIGGLLAFENAAGRDAREAVRWLPVDVDQ
jgi:hypothetical protein